MTYNNELLERIYKQIDSKPNEFNMEYWESPEKRGRITTRCIAGWACQLSNKYCDYESNDISGVYSFFFNTAKDLLKLTEQEAKFLFTPIHLFEDDKEIKQERIYLDLEYRQLVFQSCSNIAKKAIYIILAESKKPKQRQDFCETILTLYRQEREKFLSY